MKNNKVILIIFSALLISLITCFFVLKGNTRIIVITVLTVISIGYGTTFAVLAKTEAKRISDKYLEYSNNDEYEEAIEYLLGLNKNRLAFGNSINVDVYLVLSYIMIENYKEANNIVQNYKYNDFSFVKMAYYDILLCLYNENIEKAIEINNRFQRINESSIILKKNIANEFIRMMKKEKYDINLINQSKLPITSKLINKCSREYEK